MAYVPVPKDLNAVKTKVLFNLTKRQLVCFGSGAAVGVPLFFLLRQSLSNSAAAICMIVVMLPFFLFALYEKNGLPLEKIIKNIVQVCFIRPKVRPYETDNFYAVLQRQDILDKEVYPALRRPFSQGHGAVSGTHDKAAGSIFLTATRRTDETWITN